MTQLVLCHRARCSTSPDTSALRHRLGVLTFTAIAALSPGCGIGTVAAVAGLSDDDSSDVEQIEVLNEDSTPRLSRAALPEPALEGRLNMPDTRVRYLTEPTDELEVLFSKDVQLASIQPLGNVVVEVRRPTPLPPPPQVYVPVWLPVPFDEPYVLGTRRMFIPLRSETQIDGLYRVTLTGINDAEDATQLPTTTMYFVTQAGTWSEPELVAFGQSVFGSGIRLTDNLDAYSVSEAQFLTPAGDTVFTSSLLVGRFGGPWLAPRLVFQTPPSSDPREYELNTGGLGTTRTIAYFPLQEGNVSLGPLANVILRVPTAIIENEFVNFGPPITSTSGQEGVIDNGDAVSAPSLLLDHLSYSPLLRGADPAPASPPSPSRLIASWWSLTDVMGGTFQKQGAYGNGLVIDPAGPTDWSMRQWGAATHLSAGADHASWPFMVTLPDGRTIAIWWIADTTTALLSADLGSGGRYEYSEYLALGAPVQRWSPKQQITNTGPHYPITDVRELSDGNLVIFTQGGGNAPEARILELATGILYPATSPMPPAGTSYRLLLAFDDELTNNYTRFRGWRYESTPKASPIGNDEFIVRWLHEPMMAATQLTLATYRYDPATLATGGGLWGTPTVLPSGAVSSDGRNVALNVDSLGWATLITNEPDPMFSNETNVFAYRSNILVNGLASLTVATPDELSISMPGTFATFPTLSNSHASGAIATGWNFGIGPTQSMSYVRGTVISRFR